MIEYKAIAESNNFIVLDKYTKSLQISEAYQSEYALEAEFITDDHDASVLRHSPWAARLAYGLRTGWSQGRAVAQASYGGGPHHPVAPT